MSIVTQNKEGRQRFPASSQMGGMCELCSGVFNSQKQEVYDSSIVKEQPG